MSMANLVFVRGIATSCARHGKRNFRKFELINKRGSRLFKKMQTENADSNYPIDKRGVRDTGYYIGKKFVEVPEMIPELIVPNLEGFKLKAYVTYRSQQIVQPELTPQDLFNIVYAPKITEDYKNGKLGPNGEPLEPSPQEKLTPEEARAEASKTGTDLFTKEPAPLGTIFPDTLR